MSMDLFYRALKSRLPERTLSRGRRYHREGRVGRLSIDEEDGAIKALVQGGHLYEVAIGFNQRGFWNLCSCPAAEHGGACKHVIATALQADAQGLSATLLRGAVGAAPGDEEPSEPRSGGAIVPPARPGAASTWRTRLAELEPGGRRRREEAPRRDAARTACFEIWIDPDLCRREGGLILELVRRAVLRGGGYAEPKLANWASLDSYGSMAHEVRAALGRVKYRAREEMRRWDALEKSQLFVPAAESADAFRALGGALTVRHLEDNGRPGDALSWVDEPWRFALKLRSFEEQGAKAVRLRGVLRRGKAERPLSDAQLLLSGGIVLLAEEISPLDDGDAFDWIASLRDNGPLRVQGAEVAPFLEQLLPTALGVPLDLGEMSVQAGSPEGIVDLALTARGHANAAVSFQYGEAIISAANPAQHLVEGESSVRILRRNEDAERLLLDSLEAEGGARSGPEWVAHPWRLPLEDLEARCGRLIEAGWQVRVQNKPLKSSGALSMRVSSGIDWFDVRGEAVFDESALPLPEILRAVSEGRRFLTLADGGAALLPPEWVARLEALGTLTAGPSDKDGVEDGVRIARARAPLLDVLLADMADVETDESFEKLRRTLRNFKGIRPRREGKNFQGDLRDYQREGLGWLSFLRKTGLGGCLADDMGLGKTVQVLANLLPRKRAKDRRGPSLVVAPRSVVSNWIREAERFAPSLRCATYHGAGRAAVLKEIGRLDLIVTTYGTMRRDIATLSEIPFDYAILDESQAIKNASSKTARAARLLNASHRLALSGTPIENHLDELGSLFAFLNPGLLGTKREFQALLGTTGTPTPERMAWLQTALRPLILRRTREQVLTELPSKEEQILRCPLTDTQRTAYEGIREHYRASVLSKVEESGLARSKMHVLEALLRLRQAACHPGLVDSARKGESAAKLEQLLPMLEEISDAGHKALVFPQFTTFLATARTRLDDMGIRYEYLDGKTQKRGECIDRFESDPDTTAFLISLKAGGTGLNLTSAQYVFLLDPWWNPAVEAQAVGRAHRMGQKNPVTVYRLIGEDTVEDRVLELQARKRELVQAVLGGVSDAPLRGITQGDLELLLG